MDCNQQLTREMSERNHIRYIWKLRPKDPTDVAKLMIISGVGRKTALLLYNHEIRTLTDIVDKRIAGLIQIPGIGKKLAIRLKEQAKLTLGWTECDCTHYKNGSYRHNQQRGQTREW